MEMASEMMGDAVDDALDDADAEEETDELVGQVRATATEAASQRVQYCLHTVSVRVHACMRRQTACRLHIICEFMARTNCHACPCISLHVPAWGWPSRSRLHLPAGVG